MAVDKCMKSNFAEVAKIQPTSKREQKAKTVIKCEQLQRQQVNGY